jgi:hypothetical protein
MPLMQPFEEEELFDKLVDYYHRIHEDVRFSKRVETLSLQQMGEVWYTYPGEQAAATFEAVVTQVKKAVNHGYDTPIILLRKAGRDILVDGHRRLRAAWELGVPWKALVMVPDRDKELGIEKQVLGQVKDLWRPGEPFSPKRMLAMPAERQWGSE